MSAPSHSNHSRRLPPRSSRPGTLARAATLAILAFATTQPWPRAARAGQPPGLGGFWQLDLEKSETLEKKLQEMHGAGGRPGFPGGGGWHGGMGGGPPMGGMGGHHGGHGGGRSDGGWHGAGGDSTRRAQMSELAHPAMSLHIEPGDDAIVLSERGHAIEVLVLGDATTAGSSIQPDAPHFQAQWKGKHLVAGAFGPGGGRMTQEFELADGGKELVIRTKLEGREGRPPLELKRVYDRSEGEGAPPAPAGAQQLPASTTPAAPVTAAPDTIRR